MHIYLVSAYVYVFLYGVFCMYVWFSVPHLIERYYSLPIREQQQQQKSLIAVTAELIVTAASEPRCHCQLQL